MSSPKEIIRQYAIKPRKRLGQSFLMEQNIIRNIFAIAQVTKNDIVVEIGAGLGVLTEELAQNAAKLIAIEIDDKLV
jgi:16S rRNA (adenine1518-N6/adenine1519-N6)-dimethyltransferase